MPALNQPGSRLTNIFAGIVLTVCGIVWAITGLVRIFSGAFAIGAGYLAGGGVLMVLALRGRANFREYLDQRAQRGDGHQP